LEKSLISPCLCVEENGGWTFIDIPLTISTDDGYYYNSPTFKISASPSNPCYVDLTIPSGGLNYGMVNTLSCQVNPDKPYTDYTYTISADNGVDRQSASTTVTTHANQW
jgi:hypothetical protein